MAEKDVFEKALKKITSAGKARKRQLYILPPSKAIVRFVKLMQEKGYVGAVEKVENSHESKLVVQLNGRLYKCGVVKPAINVRLTKLEKVAKETFSLVHTQRVGHVVLTTSAGMMTSTDAIEKNISGKIIGYFC